MKYEDMSDFEINTEIAKIVTNGDVICADDMFPAPSKSGVQVIYKVGIHGEFYDYCNNPSDAWPIIVENRISIDFWGDFWGADVQLDGEVAFEHLDKNPLRAAMICFLKMKDGRQ